MTETPSAYLRRVRSYYSRELRSYLEHVGTTWQGALARTGGDTVDARGSNLWLAARAGVRPGERLLDAGCGVCGPSMDIAEGFPGVQIEALTLCADQARTARELIAGRGLAPRIRVHVGDFHHLPFAAGSFDRALFFESSGYSYDTGLLAREALRVLRPGGTLYVKGVFLADGPLAPEMAAQFELFDEVYAHRSLPITDLLQAVAAAGFTAIASCELNDVLSPERFFAAMFESDGRGGQQLTPFGLSHHRALFSLRPVYGEIKARKPAERRRPPRRGGSPRGAAAAPQSGAVYELLLDEDEKGLWEYEVFGALARHFASRLELRWTDAKTFDAGQPGFARERVELHHHLAILRHTRSRRYWVLDSHDWITPFNPGLHAFALDRRCRAVLKCQYARASYACEPLTKIRPWTYFETYSARFQALLPELRAIPKVRQPLFFRGNTAWAGRQTILAGLAERDVVIRDFALQVPYESYARELAAHRVALALEGMGKLCHREIEAFGAGTPVLMPRLRVELHEPLIPDHHYVAVDADAGVEPPEEVVRRIAERYRQVTADPGYLDFVAANAIAWYDRNVRMPASLDLTLRLLDLGPRGRRRDPRRPRRPPGPVCGSP